RDNTNDGDGWDIRLHHFTGLSEHGYPSLFKNFKGEFIEPLAIYGGGSGCGGLYLSEPETIASVLKAELNSASGEQAAFVVQELSRNNIQSDDTLKTVIALAERDPDLLPAVAAQLARADHLPPSSQPLLVRAATAESIDPLARAHAVTALSRL